MFFTISLKEPTAIELADVPTGLDVTSSFRHLWSLREFINTLRPSNSILHPHRHAKAKDERISGRLLRKASVMAVMIAGPEATSCENALIAEIIKQEPTIWSLTCHMKVNWKSNWRFACSWGDRPDGEQSAHTFDEGKAFRSLRKPVKPAQLVKTLHEMLLSVLSHFESSQKISISEMSIPAPQSKWLGSTRNRLPSLKVSHQV